MLMNILGFLAFIIVFFGGGLASMKVTRFFFKGTRDDYRASSKFKSYVIPWVVAFFVALFLACGIAGVGKDSSSSQDSPAASSYVQ